MKEIIHQELKSIAHKITNLPLTEASIVLLKSQVQSLYEKLVIAEYQQRNVGNFAPPTSVDPSLRVQTAPISVNESFHKPVPQPTLEDILSQVPKEPVFEEKNQVKEVTKTLNDVINSKNIQFALNDKIAFINHLFEGSEADFSQAVMALGKLSSSAEVTRFVQERIKPIFNHWQGKEEYEERFLNIITRRFN